MSHIEFVTLVARMRASQRAYLAMRWETGRSQSEICEVLHESKRLEKAVDEAVKEARSPQYRLFE